ncbi:MAG TPA: hypothetical protein VFE12_15410 [Acetobacteraceae bacterium]|nr:hypothetical protein [Acetobacteraceae bacterium]
MTSSAARKFTAAAILGLATIATVAVPKQANAWWHHGYGYGWGGVGVVLPPVVVAPPVYAPAPAYYAPGPAYYAPSARPWIPAHWQDGYWVPGHWG